MSNFELTPLLSILKPVVFFTLRLFSLVLEISTGTHSQNLTCQSNGPLSLIPINPGEFN